MSSEEDVLPDMIEHNLKAVICGNAAGQTSAQQVAYYAGSGNKFWQTLHQVGLTCCQLSPDDFEKLLRYGVGLTDLVKSHAGNDRNVRATEADRCTLRKKILEYKPKWLAFNGKKAAEQFLTRRVDYGKQLRSDNIGGTRLFVLPSTSSAAGRYWKLQK